MRLYDQRFSREATLLQASHLLRSPTMAQKRKRDEGRDGNEDNDEGKIKNQQKNIVHLVSEMILQVMSSSSSSSTTTDDHECSFTKKQLKRMVRRRSKEQQQQHRHGDVEKIKKKHIKQALKVLVDKGHIQKHEKSSYRISSTTTTQITSNENRSEEEDDDDDEKEGEDKPYTTPLSILPIGMRLRQAHTTQPQQQQEESTSGQKPTEDSNNDSEQKKKKVHFVDDVPGGVQDQEEEEDMAVEDLDDEIARLERELAAESDDDDDDDDSDFDSEGGEGDDQCDGEVHKNQSAVLSLSQFANDHVEHLPSTCLPAPSHSKGGTVGEGTRSKKSKSSKSINNDKNRERNSGLQQAVQEVLQGYTARSADRLPFYCRFCAKQYTNETEFFDHKRTEFHMAAVETERKMTYCKLCRKQLTSPAQMQEHLKSKPHKERLIMMQNKQRMGSNRNNHHNASGRHRQNPSFDSRGQRSHRPNPHLSSSRQQQQRPLSRPASENSSKFVVLGKRE
jgi:Zinc-finger double-stranded RNA-binding